MNSPVLERLRARARAVVARAEVRRWQYRQRHLAAGVWYRLRRVLADAREAYVISADDAGRLVSEGYRAEPCGAGLEPPKTILVVDPSRLSAIDSRRPIPVGLGPDLLTAPAIALVAFDGLPRRD